MKKADNRKIVTTFADLLWRKANSKLMNLGPRGIRSVMKRENNKSY